MATTLCPTKAEELELFDMFVDSLPNGYLLSMFTELRPGIMRAMRSDLAILDFDIKHREKCCDDLEDRARRLAKHVTDLEERGREARRRMANVAKYARDICGEITTTGRCAAELAAMAEKGWNDSE